jgi:hypothetical protein
MPDTTVRPSRIPARHEAEAMLDEAGGMNPGPWVDHSRHVASAARAIAACRPTMDAGAAYVVGLLHDLGRRAGVTGARHVIDGYAYLAARGYEDAGRVCLTHSFSLKQVDSIYGAKDWTEDERRFLQQYLASIEYDLYDRLIQLCDALALPTGCCLLEKRLVDVVLRYGAHEYTVAKWQATIATKDEFEAAIGGSIYRLLPGVVANTFGAIK